MNLLYVNADRGIPLDGVKGASVHVRQTVHALAERGVSVQVAATRAGSGVGRDDVGVVTVPPAAGSGSRMSALEGELREIARSIALVDAVLDSGVSVDAVYERYSLWSLAGVAIAERFGVPLVVEVNAPLVEEQARFRMLRMESFAREIEATVLRSADAVLCVSPPLVGRAARIRDRAEGVLWTPNSVDVDRFRPSRPSRSDHAGTTVIFVGSLKPWHGVDVLVEAFSLVAGSVPGAVLEIVGDGPERSRLEDLARERGVHDRVRLVGAVDHDEVPRRLAAADVAVAPYPPTDEFYFSPLKLGEYLAAGVPVVCSEVPGIARGLIDGESVVLVPPGRPPELAVAIGRLLADGGTRARIGAAGRRVAVERYSLRAATDRLLDLLTSLTSAAPTAAAGGPP